MSLAIGARFGHYEVLALEGKGGMGEVYRARDTRLHREVALKVLPTTVVLDADSRTRFEREGRMLAALNHAGIAAIHGIEIDEGVHALVLELVDGPTLRDLIARGALPLREALRIAREIATALEAAHELGIVHRDLKPANIKVRADGSVKLLDFGLAKAVAPERDEATITRATAIRSVVGTPAYMSPEQATGHAVDSRTDIWAFGCVLFEMLTGTQAFPDTGRGVAEAGRPNWAALPRDLAPVLRSFLHRCLQHDPKQRVRDVGDLRLALDGAFDAPGEASSTAPPPPRWRRAVAVALGGIALSALAGAGVWLTARGAPDRSEERTLAFVVHPPTGTRFAPQTMQPYPALSPDARYLAFRAPLEGTQAVWVQELGKLEARPLPGTRVDGPGAIFWSPDSRSLGFTASEAGRLSIKLVDAFAGLAPRELCTCEIHFGGTWSTDGSIALAGESGLSRVSSDGGAATQLTRLDPSRGEFSHRWPVFLPDGRRFLYLIRSTQDEHRGVFLGSVDDPTLKRRLVPDDSNGAYGVGPDGRGYLFFVRDVSLMAQAFDPVRGELSGLPVVVARPVIPGQEGRLAPFAVAGRTLVHRRDTSATNQLRWTSRSGHLEGTLGDASGQYLYPSLSPDGSHVTVTRVDPRTAEQDIWVLDVRRGTSERLTRDLDAMFALWTPDGRVVFASPRAGPWDLYWRSPAATDGEHLLFGAPRPRSKYPRDITRDGRTLLYQDDNGGLWSLPLVGGHEPSLVLPHGIDDARVSPDGRWLAYTSAESGTSQLYITTFPKPFEQRRISTTGGQDPQWKSDGTELYFFAEGMLWSVTVRPGQTFDNDPPRALFRTSLDASSEEFGWAYAPSPDGQRFLVIETVEPEQRALSVTMNWRPEGTSLAR